MTSVIGHMGHRASPSHETDDDDNEVEKFQGERREALEGKHKRGHLVNVGNKSKGGGPDFFEKHEKECDLENSFFPEKSGWAMGESCEEVIFPDQVWHNSQPGKKSIMLMTRGGRDEEGAEHLVWYDVIESEESVTKDEERGNAKRSGTLPGGNTGRK